jgi:hypothetical protein
MGVVGRFGSRLAVLGRDVSTALRADDCAELYTPCPCGWCKRYGNPDVSTGIRPPIRNGSMLLEIAGRCTRCHYELGETAYMVRETRYVPVCEVCVTGAERNYQRDWVTCAGCGRRLSVPRWRTSRLTSLMDGGHPARTTCNNACLRRALRKKRRAKCRVCTVCRDEFTSARGDAKYCSGVCRQWAYRLPAGGP